MLQLNVNGQHHEVAMEADMPLLWVLRDGLKLTGTKFNCGIAVCGTCVVLVNGKPLRSCVTPVSAVAGKKITTIEGLSDDNSHAVQQAWIEEEVPQCGYCQSGQILTAAALQWDIHPDDCHTENGAVIHEACDHHNLSYGEHRYPTASFSKNRMSSC